MTIPTKFNRRLALGGGLSLAAAAALSACGGGGDPLASGSSSPVAAGKIVVGSANFSENQILACIYAQALTAKGVEASTKLNIGQREIYIPALRDGSINIMPEYTGNLLAYFKPDTTAKTAAEVEGALPDAVGTNLKILKPSQAVDQDVYCVTKDFSTQNGITSLADLSKMSGELTLGGPTEMQKRPYGPPGLKSEYGTVVKFKAYDSPAVKVKDLIDGKIQLADFFTTDAAILDNGFVKLEDPKSMILPQNVIPLVAASVADNTEAVAALNAVSAKLTTDDLTKLVKMVDSDKQNPEDVAKTWLDGAGL